MTTMSAIPPHICHHHAMVLTSRWWQTTGRDNRQQVGVTNDRWGWVPVMWMSLWPWYVSFYSCMYLIFLFFRYYTNNYSDEQHEEKQITSRQWQAGSNKQQAGRWTTSGGGKRQAGQMMGRTDNRGSSDNRCHYGPGVFKFHFILCMYISYFLFCFSGTILTTTVINDMKKWTTGRDNRWKRGSSIVTWIVRITTIW